MHRRRWIALGLCAAAGTASALTLLLTSTDSQALTGPGQVRVTSRQVLKSEADVGAVGSSTGDVTVTSSLVYNRRVTTKPIGHSEMLCTYLGRGGSLGSGSRHCTTTVFLPQGKLVAEGITHNMFFYELVVVGGTGIYSNVQGTLTVTFLGSGPRRELLLFRLTV